MEKEILNIFIHYLTENRIAELVNQNEKYQITKQIENEAHDKLEKSLSLEQNVLLNNYISATIDTKAILEQLHYLQGMKDLFAFFKELS